MKSFVTLFIFAGIFFNNAASASTKVASNEFMNHVEVKLAVNKVVSTLKRINGFNTIVDLGKPSVAELGGGCGFAGCESAYLVTMTITPQVTNSQSEVVAAYVNLMNGYPMSLKVIPANQFKALLQNLQK
ncbi:MAG TPA: hypothetical protein VNJ01_05690 [Bacteriovoracaceae bacterium]|nr:hypothetical protein [Bacteriovoracaceae bacterium]